MVYERFGIIFTRFLFNYWLQKRELILVESQFYSENFFWKGPLLK